MRPGLTLILLSTLLLASCPSGSGRIVTLTVRTPLGSGLDLARTTFDPPAALRGVTQVDPYRLVARVDIDEVSEKLRIDHPEGCSVALSFAPDASAVEAQLSPLIELTPDQPQVGFGARFEIEARPGCTAAQHGHVEWTQVGGPSLIRIEPSADGFRMQSRTHERRYLIAQDPVPWGLLPISPRTRGDYTLEAKLTTEDGREIVRRTHVAAAARASGIPSLALDHTALLLGVDWTIRERIPNSAQATLTVKGDVTEFTGVEGRFVLVDGQGRDLRLSVDRYDETVLDCGRPECHASAAEHALTSPMTTIFRRGIEGQIEGYEPGCAVACHTLGEPGTNDGGFVHLAREFGHAIPTGEDAWSALPRAMRRVGSVGCGACHGPAAIPEPTARWAILRADVCATCHDAPPRYGQVAAWRESRMSRSDELVETRVEPCARCHTTAGFLAAVGIREIVEERRAPAHAGFFGVACSACHATHGDHVDKALVRRIAPPATLAAVPEAVRNGPGNVCLTCHSPTTADGAPEASSAAILYAANGPHASLPDGCVTCHRGRRLMTAQFPLDAGGNHGFAADLDTCTPCHAQGAPRDQTIATRAIDLYNRLAGALPVDRPLHAQPIAEGAPDRAPMIRNLRLVIEDRGAWAHNPAYARSLLDQAEAESGPPR